MKIGDLVQIKHRECHGLFIVILTTPPYDSSTFVRLYSLKDNRICYDLMRSLEVINESR
jgi:hypothetical protein